MESFKEKVIHDYIKYNIWQNDLFKNGSLSKKELLNALELFFMAGNFQGYAEYMSLYGLDKQEQKKHAELLNKRIVLLKKSIVPSGIDYYIEGLYKELDDNDTSIAYPDFYNNLDFEKTKTTINQKEKTINQITAYEAYGSMPKLSIEDYINMLSENEDILFITGNDGEISYGGKNV